MKIILTFPDLGEESERCIIEWINNIVADKDVENLSPLRYVEKVEVINPNELR